MSTEQRLTILLAAVRQSVADDDSDRLPSASDVASNYRRLLGEALVAIGEPDNSITNE